ncbi:MAG: hypothetical protein M3O87_05530 [Candidatus Dormibacteraeota bacterium]|nr:hypothetical protein [Candidatus Dormibacteraeota bacterium]
MNRLHPGPGRRVAAIVAAAASLAGAFYATGAPSVALAAPASVFVYTGSGALDEGYTKFGTAAGRPVAKNAVLPADLSPYACVVLPINNVTFTAPQITEFSNYVNTGGTLVALGERSTFTAANANMNGLATGLSSGMQIVDADISGTSTNVVASAFTVGVTSYKYTNGAQLTVSAPGQVLVNNTGVGIQPPVIGAAVLGTGVFVLSGDSNAFSDNDVSAYTAASNGTLVANLCAPRPTSTAVVCPNLNAGQAATCTVTVTDTDAAGLKSAPSGTVSFASDSGGTFGNGGTCTLAATSTPGQSSCTIPFTPGTSGNVTATYAGDVRHTGSSRQAAAAVTPAAVPTLPKAGANAAGSIGTSGAVAVLILTLLGAAVATGAAVFRTRRARS